MEQNFKYFSWEDELPISWKFRRDK